jgi:glutamate-5-semialdehyde dehydrogenase
MSSPVRRTELRSLRAGQEIPFGGDRVVEVGEELATAFAPGDRLIVVQQSGDLIHVPRNVSAIVDEAVAVAVAAAPLIASASTDAVSRFFAEFANRLADDRSFAVVAAANELDFRAARERGRPTGRLELSAKMRGDMIEALRMWRDLDLAADESVGLVDHGSWSVEERRAPLGVVGFVFEGRPNVFADATGVLRSGNAVVFRIGSDALRTAQAIHHEMVGPALVASGLPVGAVVLVESGERSAGHALFSDRRLGLAVARGSGDAVAQLGAVARQSGIPVSLHGTGGAWILVDRGFSASDLTLIIESSLDRKVCNTLNVLCLPVGDGAALAAALTGISAAAARRRRRAMVHCRASDRAAIGSVVDSNLTADHDLSIIDHPDDEFLESEWEWDDDPECSIVFVGDVSEACDLFNRHSPRFVVSVLSNDPATMESVYRDADAPFVGNGFTRWVDGQYALGRPELGLSNWQHGRLFARGGILSGDGVFSVRYMARHTDPHQRR